MQGFYGDTQIADRYLNEDAILDELDMLGSTPNEVASTLTNLGILGRRHDATQCPIAQFLMRRFDSDAVVSTGQWAVVDHVTVEVPDAIGMFINGFDAGDYPLLDAQ